VTIRNWQSRDTDIGMHKKMTEDEDKTQKHNATQHRKLK